jgi:hypothetical protein
MSVDDSRAGAVQLFKELLLRAKARAPTTFAEVFKDVAGPVFVKVRNHAGCMLKWVQNALAVHNMHAKVHNEQAKIAKPDMTEQDDEYWPIMPPVLVNRSSIREYITLMTSHGRTFTSPDWDANLWNQVDSDNPPWWATYIPKSAEERKLFHHQYAVCFNDFFFTNLPDDIQVVDVLARKSIFKKKNYF